MFIGGVMKSILILLLAAAVVFAKRETITDVLGHSVTVPVGAK